VLARFSIQRYTYHPLGKMTKLTTVSRRGRSTAPPVETRRSFGARDVFCCLGLKLPEPLQRAEAGQKAILPAPCDYKP